MITEKYQSILTPAEAEQIGKVGVLYGGLSAEREVSLWSGQAIYDALTAAGIEAELIDVQSDFLAVVQRRSFDFAFIALHGRGGEDGTIQAILDWAEIPYTGSGVRASAIAMDKVRTKQLWQANGLPVLPQTILTDGFDVDAVIAEVGLPMAVKPALEGSSVGITKVKHRDELLAAYESASQHQSVIMAERWIDGDELTGPVLGDKVMPLIRIKMQEGFYDYKAKYITGATAYECPCGLPEAQEKAIQDLMLQAAKVIGTKAWARVDVMLDGEGQPWLLEINTIPGMTKTSLVPKSTRQVGMDFETTVLTILKLSWEAYHA